VRSNKGVEADISCPTRRAVGVRRVRFRKEQTGLITCVLVSAELTVPRSMVCENENSRRYNTA